MCLKSVSILLLVELLFLTASVVGIASLTVAVTLIASSLLSTIAASVTPTGPLVARVVAVTISVSLFFLLLFLTQFFSSKDRLLRLEIIQLLLHIQRISLIQHCRSPLLLVNHVKFFENLDQNVRIKSSIVLLRQPQRSQFPIRHLLTLAHIHFQYILGHLGQPNLRALLAYAPIERLGV